MEWLRQFPGPVYIHIPDADLPNGILYPFEAISQDIGLDLWRLQDDRSLRSFSGEPYLSSSIAYQIALAIHEKFEEIHLYGIDLNTDGEYAWQKAGVEHLLGIAAGRGMRVVLPENCPLLRGKLYGRGFMSSSGEAVSASQYEVRLKHIREQAGQAAAQANQLQGAERELRWILEQMPPGLDHEKLMDRLKSMEAMVQQQIGVCNQLAGSEREIAYWISMTPEGQDGREAMAQLSAPSLNGAVSAPSSALVLAE